MSPAAKWEYMKTIYERYRQARKKDKKPILDEFCKVYKCHRKHAIRLLNGAPPGEQRPKRQGGGNIIYGERVVSILEAFWKALGCLWSHRMKAALPLWLPWIRKHFPMTPQEERQLLSMSASTMDRRLKAKKQEARKRLYGTTKPGKWLRHQIPIQIEHWGVRKPGYTEMDLVSHSGPCSSGLFAHTVNLTDILTCWVCRRAILGKAEMNVTEAMEDMQKHIPFRLWGVHVDNGSEFINAHMLRYCRGGHVKLTRSRPRKKDDNAHIEQKNGTHVRQLLGYVRYDTPSAVDAINALYRDLLDPFQNLFQPSVKLVKTVRRGSKLHRIFDDPQTPLDRLLQSKQGSRVKVARIKELRERIDPFELSKAIDAALDRVYAMASEFRKISVPKTIHRAFLETPSEIGSWYWSGPRVDSAIAKYTRAHYRDGLFQTKS
ncbi:MAG: integrase [Elusimicrobia bacterium]|nr:integrase [Elusimicrobiota bacterium]